MTDETGTDLETIPDNLPAVEREIERVEEAMADTYTYARSPRTQDRATKLYEAQERLKADPAADQGEGVALTPHQTADAVANIAATGEVGQEWAAELGHGENARNALQVGEDQRVALLAAMGPQADQVAMAFEGLDDNVRVAVYRELGNTFSPRLPPSDADDLAIFAGLDHGGILTKEWGGETGRRLATAQHRWNRMVQYLDKGEQDILHDFFTKRLTAPERAAIVRHLGG